MGGNPAEIPCYKFLSPEEMLGLGFLSSGFGSSSPSKEDQKALELKEKEAEKGREEADRALDARKREFANEAGDARSDKEKESKPKVCFFVCMRCIFRINRAPMKTVCSVVISLLRWRSSVQGEWPSSLRTTREQMVTSSTCCAGGRCVYGTFSLRAW